MSYLLQTLSIGVAACVVTLLLLPLVRRVALAYGITDNPDSRKLHGHPVPYLGGVAIALAALLASAFLRGWRAEATVILLGALLVGVVGLIDDLRNLHPLPRLGTELVAALIAASAGARVHIFDGPMDWVITVAWLVIITNAFNLLDNMDGAAGVIATTTALGLAIAAGLEGQYLVGGLAGVVAGCCAGFLFHNWHPARIFMGDSGSLFVGYLLAAIALKLRFPVDQVGGIVAVLLFTGPALFDTTLVVLARVSTGRSIYQGGTDHTSHRLQKLGLSTGSVVNVLALTCAVTSTLGILVGHGTIPVELVAAPVALLAGLGLVVLLAVPIYADAGRPLDAVPQPES